MSWVYICFYTCLRRYIPYYEHMKPSNSYLVFLEKLISVTSKFTEVWAYMILPESALWFTFWWYCAVGDCVSLYYGDREVLNRCNYRLLQITSISTDHFNNYNGSLWSRIISTINVPVSVNSRWLILPNQHPLRQSV